LLSEKKSETSFKKLGGERVDLAERISLVTRNAEEVIVQDELQALLEVEARPRAYWGFEPSG